MFHPNKYQDIHQGETCYIFGDGPSIKWFDMSQFSDHIGISCGMIPMHNDFNKLNIRYHLLLEPWFYCPSWMQPKYLKKNKHSVRFYRTFMKTHGSLDFFINATNFPWMAGKNINYVHRVLVTKNDKLQKVKSIVDPFGGSFHAVLSLAYLMGFSKVYLVGFDAWTIKPARTKRWYELGKGEIFKRRGGLALDFLNILKKEMDIYTISLEGESCNVKNINYEQYTNKKSDFKENHQLLSKEYLNILDSFPKCEIYKKINNKDKHK